MLGKREKVNSDIKGFVLSDNKNFAPINTANLDVIKKIESLGKTIDEFLNDPSIIFTTDYLYSKNKNTDAYITKTIVGGLLDKASYVVSVNVIPNNIITNMVSDVLARVKGGLNGAQTNTITPKIRNDYADVFREMLSNSILDRKNISIITELFSIDSRYRVIVGREKPSSIGAALSKNQMIPFDMIENDRDKNGKRIFSLLFPKLSILKEDSIIGNTGNTEYDDDIREFSKTYSDVMSSGKNKERLKGTLNGANITVNGKTQFETIQENSDIKSILEYYTLVGPERIVGVLLNDGVNNSDGGSEFIKDIIAIKGFDDLRYHLIHGISKEIVRLYTEEKKESSVHLEKFYRLFIPLFNSIEILNTLKYSTIDGNNKFKTVLEGEGEGEITSSIELINKNRDVIQPIIDAGRYIINDSVEIFYDFYCDDRALEFSGTDINTLFLEESTLLKMMDIAENKGQNFIDIIFKGDVSNGLFKDVTDENQVNKDSFLNISKIMRSNEKLRNFAIENLISIGGDSILLNNVIRSDTALNQFIEYVVIDLISVKDISSNKRLQEVLFSMINNSVSTLKDEKILRSVTARIFSIGNDYFNSEYRNNDTDEFFENIIFNALSGDKYNRLENNYPSNEFLLKLINKNIGNGISCFIKNNERLRDKLVSSNLVSNLIRLVGDLETASDQGDDVFNKFVDIWNENAQDNNDKDFLRVDISGIKRLIDSLNMESPDVFVSVNRIIRNHLSPDISDCDLLIINSNHIKYLRKLFGNTIVDEIFTEGNIVKYDPMDMFYVSKPEDPKKIKNTIIEDGTIALETGGKISNSYKLKSGIIKRGDLKLNTQTNLGGSLIIDDFKNYEEINKLYDEDILKLLKLIYKDFQASNFQINNQEGQNGLIIGLKIIEKIVPEERKSIIANNYYNFFSDISAEKDLRGKKLMVSITEQYDTRELFINSVGKYLDFNTIKPKSYLEISMILRVIISDSFNRNVNINDIDLSEIGGRFERPAIASFINDNNQVFKINSSSSDFQKNLKKLGLKSEEEYIDFNFKYLDAIFKNVQPSQIVSTLSVYLDKRRNTESLISNNYNKCLLPFLKRVNELIEGNLLTPNFSNSIYSDLIRLSATNLKSLKTSRALNGIQISALNGTEYENLMKEHIRLFNYLFTKPIEKIELGKDEQSCISHLQRIYNQVYRLAYNDDFSKKFTYEADLNNLFPEEIINTLSETSRRLNTFLKQNPAFIAKTIMRSYTNLQYIQALFGIHSIDAAEIIRVGSKFMKFLPSNCQNFIKYSGPSYESTINVLSSSVVNSYLKEYDILSNETVFSNIMNNYTINIPDFGKTVARKLLYKFFENSGFTIQTLNFERDWVEIIKKLDEDDESLKTNDLAQRCEKVLNITDTQFNGSDLTGLLVESNSIWQENKIFDKFANEEEFGKLSSEIFNKIIKSTIISLYDNTIDINSIHTDFIGLIQDIDSICSVNKDMKSILTGAYISIPNFYKISKLVSASKEIRKLFMNSIVNFSNNEEDLKYFIKKEYIGNDDYKNDIINFTKNVIITKGMRTGPEKLNLMREADTI